MRRVLPPLIALLVGLLLGWLLPRGESAPPRTSNTPIQAEMPGDKPAPKADDAPPARPNPETAPASETKPVQNPIALPALPNGDGRAGLIYTAGLRKGDMILAINGQRAQGQDGLKALWQDAKSKAAVEFEVLRNGQTLRINTTGDTLAKAEEGRVGYSYRRN